MSRRARAISFAVLALVCAAFAASLAGDYRGDVQAQLGPLMPVLAARAEIPAGRPLRPADTREILEIRQVPKRFVPADALADPLQAVGQSPRVAVPPGAYVTATTLRPLRPGRTRDPDPPDAAEAVEIDVAGAGALVAAQDALGGSFDVVATGEPRVGGGGGRTKLIARGVRLLALEEAAAVAGGGIGDPATWTATVAASRSEAFRLIEAHNYAREIRLIAAGGER